MKISTLHGIAAVIDYTEKNTSGYIMRYARCGDRNVFQIRYEYASYITCPVCGEVFSVLLDNMDEYKTHQICEDDDIVRCVNGEYKTISETDLINIINERDLDNIEFIESEDVIFISDHRPNSRVGFMRDGTEWDDESYGHGPGGYTGSFSIDESGTYVNYPMDNLKLMSPNQMKIGRLYDVYNRMEVSLDDGHFVEGHVLTCIAVGVPESTVKTLLNSRTRTTVEPKARY